MAGLCVAKLPACFVQLQALVLKGAWANTAELGNALRCLPRLRQLVFPVRDRREFDAAAVFGPYIAEGHTALVRIELDDQHVGNAGAAHLFALLATLPALEMLSLKNVRAHPQCRAEHVVQCASAA